MTEEALNYFKQQQEIQQREMQNRTSEFEAELKRRSVENEKAVQELKNQLAFVENVISKITPTIEIEEVEDHNVGTTQNEQNHQQSDIEQHQQKTKKNLSVSVPQSNALQKILLTQKNESSSFRQAIADTYDDLSEEFENEMNNNENINLQKLETLHNLAGAALVYLHNNQEDNDKTVMEGAMKDFSQKSAFVKSKKREMISRQQERAVAPRSVSAEVTMRRNRDEQEKSSISKPSSSFCLPSKNSDQIDELVAAVYPKSFRTNIKHALKSPNQNIQEDANATSRFRFASGGKDSTKRRKNLRLLLESHQVSPAIAIFH
jgi:hypothetical protein